MLEKSLPLVTVGVITYNSSKTVIETLDSIKSQTYPLSRIELLIGDDCSSDDTVLLVRDWLQIHGKLFNNTAIIESEENRGIAHNSNLVLQNARGGWFKGIAGDDLLMNECVEKFVDYVSTNADIAVCFCRIIPFGGDKSVVEKTRRNFNHSFFTKSVVEQLHFLVHDHNCLPAPGAFINMEWLKAHDLSYDERIPLLEDWPMWINMLRQGAKFGLLDEELVKYRMGGITSKRSSLKFYKSGRLFYMYYLFPEIYKNDPDEAIRLIIDDECEVYQEIERIEKTKAYRIGKIVLYPLNKIKQLLKR